ncbi:ejaculatory bulb-specific protein 3-like [Coccinella septempunctata]|uniref:ejaculatory bulb-specific protein 3-like n=1 Tax=Coccinella septempunctata TaxID=41139 RepID=UPI001D06A7C9|nr:ejaculatory bulb-specific protein 3-like [Coccinella septempunctata]
MNKLVFCIVCAISVAKVHCDILDSSKLEKIDFEAIRSNDRLLQNHFNCLIEGKGCTPEADELRKGLPEVMETCCAKCSDKHKEEANKMINFLIEKKPELLKKLLDKYDADRKYRDQCAEKLKAEGVDLSNF